MKTASPVGEPKRAHGAAPEHRPVLEDEEAAHSEWTSRPAATVFTTLPCSVSPRSHELRRLGAKGALAHGPSCLQVEEDEVGGCADGDARRLEAVDARGAGAHALEERGERKDARLDETRIERGEGSLEPGHAERRLLERDLLLLPRVRRVIGGDGADRSVAERLDQGLAVRLRAEGRVHLHVGVERPHGLVRQAEMVRGHLRRGLEAGGLPAAQRVDGLTGGEVQKVERPLLVRGEGQVPLDHDALRDRGIPAEAELCGDQALVDVSPAGERRLLAVDGHGAARRAPVLEGSAHEPRRDYRVAVVGEACRAALGELHHLRQLGALLALCDRREKADGDVRVGSRPLGEGAEQGGGVHHGVGVGHGQDRAIAARRRSSGARGEVLLVLPSRRAQVHVRIDERRREHPAVAARRRLEPRDDPLLDRHCERLVDPFTGVEHADRFEDDVVAATVSAEEHHATSSISATLTSTGPWVRRS